MKIEHAVIASFLVLITGVAGVVAKECYGTTVNSGSSDNNCQSDACAYTCVSPTYSICSTSTSPTGSICNEGPQKLSDEYNYSYTGGTCSGFSAGPPLTYGTCSGGTAS